jgi:hypothetical protein
LMAAFNLSALAGGDILSADTFGSCHPIQPRFSAAVRHQPS